MAANLNRKAVSLGAGQQQLNFGSSKKLEVIYIEREAELRALQFEAEVYIIEVQKKKQSAEMGVQTQVELIEEEKEQQPIEKIKSFQCEDCQNFFSADSSLKRHIKEIHASRAKIYFKHDKVDGRYQCKTCMKSYTHSDKVKRHMQKHNLSEFLIKDEETQKLIPAKRKNNYLESQREQEERLKRQKRFESMNQPANAALIACLQERVMYIPTFNAIDIDSCIENYFHFDLPNKAQLIVIDEFAYKVFPLKLDGVILGHAFVALRLKKFEITFRDYLYQNRYPDDLNEILSEMIQGVKELHELCYVHRDLKPENYMLNLCQLEIVVIDFNRAIRQEILTLAKVIGTPGYFPIREKWTNGSVEWHFWAVAAKIQECDMESMSYFVTKHDKQSISLATKHIQQEDVCNEIKKLVEMIIVRAPGYPRQSQEDLREQLQRARFKRYHKDKQINLFELSKLYSLNFYQIHIIPAFCLLTPIRPQLYPTNQSTYKPHKGVLGF